MAWNLEQIKEKFYRYSGENPADESARGRLCAELCGECSSRAESLLEEGRISDAGRTEELLESWAAAEAFYQLALTDEASLPESVSADGVQIQWGERSRKAKALAAEKRRNLSSALGEEEFYFGRA